MLTGTVGALPLESHYASDIDVMGAAFQKRGSAHWMMGRPTPVPLPQETYRSLLTSRSTEKRSVYFHIPFCVNHCLFCGFYRNRADQVQMRAYAAQLLAEIEEDALTAAGPIHAVYFGGGTPTALQADDLYALIAAVRRNLPLAPDCEITVEGRVFDFSLEKVEACLAAGVNRFSIGIQSFDTQLRRRFGRKASGEDAALFMSALRKTERAAVVCDLIYGLPGQTMQSWLKDVRTCVELELDGVDLYRLSLFEKGPLAQSIAKGALPQPPQTHQMAQMYAAGLDLLEEAGWRHLTQAHWSRTTRERNFYNQFSKAGVDCLAFGVGAGGMLGGHRFMLEGEREAYAARRAAQEKPIAMMFAPSPAQFLRNHVTANVEGGYLNLSRLEAMTAPGLVSAITPLLQQWETAGLVRRKGEGLLLETPGWFWAANLTDSLVQLGLQYQSAGGQNSSQGGTYHVH
jgi:oxygen-independent coproporphyrinogen-3 oxidase